MNLQESKVLYQVCYKELFQLPHDLHARLLIEAPSQLVGSGVGGDMLQRSKYAVSLEN
jgi:hypothetical protein